MNKTVRIAVGLIIAFYVVCIVFLIGYEAAGSQQTGGKKKFHFKGSSEALPGHLHSVLINELQNQ